MAKTRRTTSTSSAIKRAIKRVIKNVTGPKAAKRKAPTTAKRKTAARKATARKTAAKRGSGKRTTIDTGRTKMYAKRTPTGKFKEMDVVGRSLSADRRQKAKAKTKSGYGDTGDRKKR